MNDPSPMVSGDLCMMRQVAPGHVNVEHFRCDLYADGTVTAARTGEVVTPAPPGAPRGFATPRARQPVALTP